MSTSAVAQITDQAVADVKKAILAEALRVVRKQTMMLSTKAHLAAMDDNRRELLAALGLSVGLLDALVNEIETTFGSMPMTREKLAGLQRVLAEQESL